MCKPSNVVAIIVLIGWSCFTLASPKVGDEALYHVHQTFKNGTSVDYTLDESLTAYDSLTQEFTLTRTTNNPLIGFSSLRVKASELMNDDKNNTIGQVAACGGRLTVPAGTFKVCYLDDFSANNIWTEVYFGRAIAPGFDYLPILGHVKRTDTDQVTGDVTMQELVSYRFGH